MLKLIVCVKKFVDMIGSIAHGGREGCNQIEELEKAETVKAIPLWWVEMLAESINSTYGGDEDKEFKKQCVNAVFDVLIDKWKCAN